MRCLDSENSDNLPWRYAKRSMQVDFERQTEVEVSPGDTSDVFGQV